MKLELKHIAPYLPYGLKVITSKNSIHIIKGFHDYNRTLYYHFKDKSISDFTLLKVSKCKPILRPLSDITKEIKHKGIKFIPAKVLGKFSLFDGMPNISLEDDYLEWSVWEYEYLLEWHFDVFGLIDTGLAIDINTIDKL